MKSTFTLNKSLGILLAIMLYTSCNSKSKSVDDAVTNSDNSILAEETRHLKNNILGIWKYTYSHSTENLIEDHYMKFEVKGDSLQGWYFGTTDDFDEAREHYLPGFFIVRMENLNIKNDSISFLISLADNKIYSHPIPLDFTDETLASLDKWDIGLLKPQRVYSGIYVKNGILFSIYSTRDRAFLKMMD
jgi:hypothetical protein